MKVERATTGWVTPWDSTRWVWIVHVMLNNTQLLIPDLTAQLNYLNTTFHLNVTAGQIDNFTKSISKFNSTQPSKQPVLQTYFIVDNETGVAFTPNANIGPLEAFDPAKYNLGEWLQRGYAFLVLQYFAQTYLNQTWSKSENLKLNASDLNSQITSLPVQIDNNRTLLSFGASVNATAKVAGTDYLTFPGGGGGNCWKLVNSVNASGSVAMSTNLTQPQYPTLSGPVINASVIGTTSGYVDIERYSGFPLKFQQHLSVNSTGSVISAAGPLVGPLGNAEVLNWSVSLGLDLSAVVPSSNITWMSYETTHITVGAGENATYGNFDQYGFHVTINGANGLDVDITGSASPPPETGAPPSGSISFVYLNVKGAVLPGSNVIELYVFINRTKASSLGIDEYSMHIYTWNATAAAWQQIVDPQGKPASHYVYINATTGCIIGELYHLSYFAVLGAPPTTSTGISSTVIIIAAVAAIVIVAAVVMLKKRK
jgi:hypothetical protein